MARGPGATERRVGLGLRIFAGATLAVVASLALTLALTTRSATAAASRTVLEGVGAAAGALELALDARLDRLAGTLGGLAQVPAYLSRVERALAAGDQPTLLDAAREFRAQGRAAWVLLTDRTGVLAAWTLHPELVGEPLGDGALVAGALAGREMRGGWLESLDDGDRLYQAAAAPLRDPASGTVIGVLVAALPIDGALIDSLGIAALAEVVVAVVEPSGAQRPLLATPGAPPAEAVAAAGREGEPFAFDAASDEWLGRVVALPTAGGEPLARLTVLRARGAALAPFAGFRSALWAAFGAGLLCALVAALLLARQVARPAARLAAAVREVAMGRLEVTVPADGPRELADVGDAVRRLVGDLRAKEELVALLRAQPTTAEARAAAPDTLGPGRVLAGRYLLLEALGEGGMGVVFRALDQELGETVALKVLRGMYAEADSTGLERFRQELRLARRITHRNVVRVHDLGEADGLRFITMEFVTGRTLDSVLRQRRQLPAPATVAIGRQLCQALAAAHAMGVVHRDIKPANLLLDGAGVLKVTDFGIARLADPAATGASAAPLTQVGHLIGTPAYMAPEQLANEAVDGRTDLYAGGLVLLECLAGQNPRAGLGLHRLLAQAIDGEVLDVAALAPGAPPALVTVVARALATRPDDRWPTASAMADALANLEGELT